MILNFVLLAITYGTNSIFSSGSLLISTQLSNPKNSGTTVYPYQFTGIQGTLVRLNVKLSYISSGASPVSLKSKPIYFEINLNGTWQRIDEDGITTTNQTTNSSGLGENYYIIPDNLAKGTYQIRVIFSGDSEYAASLLTGMLTVNEPTNELISIPNDNSGYTGEKIALVLVHGDGVDEDTNQPLNRWDTFINFIAQNKSLFKEFDIYRWRHTTAIPIGFNGTTGNAKQLAKDLAILGNKKIVFVAHSQGGLICRSFMNGNTPQTNVLGLITLATPHHGSPFAVPDWDGIMWARKVGTSALTGANLFNELIVSQTTNGLLSTIFGLSEFTYDRMGSLNLAWDNEDEAINTNKTTSFPLASFSGTGGIVELSSNDFNTISTPSVTDQTILYSADVKNRFGTLKVLNETEKFKDKIITYGCFDDNLTDNRNFGELLVIFSFFSEHEQLKIVTKFLSEFGEIANPGRSYYANDGLVPLQSALFLDITGGTQFATNVSGVVQSATAVDSKKQVKLQRIFYGSRDGIRDHLDLLDASITNATTLKYWNTLANDIRSFIPVQDNISPTVSYSTSTGQWFSANSLLNIDFTDNTALENSWYQIDSNNDSNPSNWHLLTSDGTNTLTGSQKNSGTSLTTNWKISDADWGLLSQGMHSIYFKVTDDSGNTFITPDQTSAFSFGKDDLKPIVGFASPTDNTNFYTNSVEVKWIVTDATAGISSSGIDKIYYAIDQNSVYNEVGATIDSHLFNELTNGSHIVSVKAKDKAGNESLVRVLNFTVHVPYSLLLTAGDNQSSTVLTTLNQPFVVTLRDAGNSPIAGVTIGFEFGTIPLNSTGQNIGNNSVITDAKGEAKCILTLGDKEGAYKIVVSSLLLPGSIVTFTAVAVPKVTRILSVTTTEPFNYGNVILNNTGDNTFSLQNTGNASIIVSNLTLGGANADQFIITNPSGSSFEITSNGKIDVTVRFKPLSSGVKNGNLIITNNSDNAPQKTVGLIGTGIIPQEYHLPTVTTNSVTELSVSAVECGGNVIADGGLTVSERGVCWNIAANPTIADSKTSDGTGIGVFTSSISGLSAGNTYHFRAYATNSLGTAYGADVPFTTNSGPTKPVLITPNSTEVKDETKPIVFQWTASIDADHDPVIYKVHLWGNGKDTTIINVTQNSHTLPANILKKESSYTYNITATDGKLENISADETFKTTPAPLIPGSTGFIVPVNLSENVEYNPIVYSWSLSPNAINYQLQIATDQSFTQVIKDVTISKNDTSIILYGNRTYYNRVRGKNGEVFGPWSGTLSFTTKNNPPSGFQYVSPTMDQEVSLESGRLTIETTIPADPDNDALTKKIHVTGTGLDTLITIDATVRICYLEATKLKSNTEFRINSEVTDGKAATVVPELRFKTPVSTGIIETTARDQIKVYPNPTRDFIYLEFQPENTESVTIGIFEITGKLIRQQTEKVYQNQMKQIDFRNLPAGLYLIRIILKQNNGDIRREAIKIMKH
jgi:hypothetical protein